MRSVNLYAPKSSRAAEALPTIGDAAAGAPSAPEGRVAIVGRPATSVEIRLE